jgi:hypothetical protein
LCGVLMVACRQESASVVTFTNRRFAASPMLAFAAKSVIGQMYLWKRLCAKPRLPVAVYNVL